MAYIELKNIPGIGTQDIVLSAGTYFISSIVSLGGYKITFDCSDGNIIVKRNSSFYFTNVGEINTVNSSITNKVYWTTVNDDTIGDIIAGSTGVPTVIQNGINRGAAISAPGTFKYWEIRWMTVNSMLSGSDPSYNGYIFNFIGNYTRTFQNIDFKNCYFATTTVFMSTARLSFTIFKIDGGTTNFEYIDFDDTNTVPFRDNLYGGNYIYFASISSLINVHDIFALGFISSASFLTLNYTGQLNIGQSNEIKNVKVIGTSGFSIATKYNTNLENICAGGVNISSNDVNIEHDINFKNCIFDRVFSNVRSLNGFISNSYSSHLNFNNCIFRNWRIHYKPNNSYIWDGKVFAGNELNISVNNCIFVNNQYLTKGVDTGNLQKTGDYNCFYDNTYHDLGNNDLGQHGSHDLFVNPNLISALPECVINSEFEKYIPDGYFVGNIDVLQGKGSDTFDNLSIDENLYTPTGYKYLGTHYITPGINYLVDSFYSNVTYAFEIDSYEPLDYSHTVAARYINVPQNQILSIENELGTNPAGSMINLKTRLAVSINDDGTLKYSASGVTGIQGIQGDTGLQGNQGNTGIQGLQGNQGDTGIQGIQGNTGIQGTQGDTGIQGLQGTQGETGIQGLQGTQGDTGIQGTQGNTGIQGIQGSTGVDGTSGMKIKSITVTSVDGTFAFVFSDQGLTDYADSDYVVYLTPTGTNATKCWAVVSGSKTTTGFTIACMTSGTNGTSAYNASVSGGGNVIIDVITVYM